MIAYSPLETARASPPDEGMFHTKPPAQKYRVAPSGEAVSAVMTPLAGAMRAVTRPLEVSAKAMTERGAGPMTKAISRGPAIGHGSGGFFLRVDQRKRVLPFFGRHEARASEGTGGRHRASVGEQKNLVRRRAQRKGSDSSPEFRRHPAKGAPVPEADRPGSRTTCGPPQLRYTKRGWSR